MKTLMIKNQDKNGNILYYCGSYGRDFIPTWSKDPNNKKVIRFLSWAEARIEFKALVVLGYNNLKIVEVELVPRGTKKNERIKISRYGGIGRHHGLKIRWNLNSVPVRARLPAPYRLQARYHCLDMCR